MDANTRILIAEPWSGGEAVTGEQLLAFIQANLPPPPASGGLTFVDQSTPQTLDISAQDFLTEFTIGPTGSEADIEWDALDGLDYSALYLFGQITGQALNSDNDAQMQLYVGPTPLPASESVILLDEIVATTVQGQTLQHGQSKIISVPDENGIFACQWNCNELQATNPGHQTVDLDGSAVGAGATGLANDATEYTATITIDGTPIPVLVVGDDAQTFDELIAVINGLLGAAGEIGISGGNLQVISASAGLSSTVSITDVDLFMSLTNFVQIFPAVNGTQAPTALLNLLAYQPAA